MASLKAIHFIFIAVIGQGLFLSFLLLRKRDENRLANRWLAVAVFLMTYFTFVFLLNDTGYRRYLPIIVLNGYGITPLIPVAFYFYFRELTGRKLGKHYWIHFTPFIIQFLYWFPNNTHGWLFHVSEETMSSFYSTTIVRSVTGVHILLFLIYGMMIFKGLRFGGLARNQQSWLKKVRTLYFMLVTIFTLGVFSIWFTETELVRYSFFLFMSFFIYLIGYRGYALSSDFVSKTKTSKPKYYHSHLTPAESSQIFKQLQRYIELEKPHLQPSIKLAEVASALEIPSHHLSRAINENHGDNFLDFINRYRIEEAKKILRDEDRKSYKMLAVAMDAGFGNKVSFYKNFKKFTGSLPTEFRHQT